MIDFDGRATLHDVHSMMLDTLGIGDDDHLYAFFLSGRYWDPATAYVDPRSDGRRADQALLFRLRLQLGQRFVYLYGDERRYSLTVVSVTETDTPLSSPVLIESSGEAPLGLDRFTLRASNSADVTATDPELREPFELAAAVLEQVDALDDVSGNANPEHALPVLRKLSEATLALLRRVDGNMQLLSAVDLEFDLIGHLLDMPAQLSVAGETELALRVAEALKFYAPDQMNGEIALVYARSGDRERALARVLTNLETTTEPFIAENKSGDVYRQLGEADAAEAYYRRALALAETASDRTIATLRIASLLIESGREADAAAFLAQQRADANTKAESAATKLPSVGRNDPSPCGSGKKYKKCHGA